MGAPFRGLFNVRALKHFTLTSLVPNLHFFADMADDWNNWKKVFDLVGVTEDQMLTKGTLDFLYCFVRKRGGVNNVIRELQGDPLAPTGNYQRTGLKSSFRALLIFLR